MKAKSIIITATVIIGLIQPLNVFPRQSNGLANRPDSPDRPSGHAGESSRQAGEELPDTLETLVPREGLRFYVEISSAGLAGLAGGGNAVALGKMLAAEPLKLATSDLVSFVLTNSTALSKARLALVGYGTGGTAAVVEAANSQEAAQLAAGLSRLLSARKLPGKPTVKEIEVAARGRIVVAGARATTALLAETKARTISGDPELMKARSRLSEDPIFAFIELGSGSLGMPMPSDASADAAYKMGALAALSGMPYAMALGGSIAGDSAKVRALFIGGPKQNAGVFGSLFSSLTSATISGKPAAAALAVPNADVFVDLMVDWDKLLDSIQAMFAMFAGALAGNPNDPGLSSGLPPGGLQNADLFAMLESSLGFSIKHDLIPTLGNEIAISLSGFNGLAPLTPASRGRSGSSAAKKSAPRFMLLLAVRDAAKFEKLLARMISGPRPSTTPMISRTTYRGATINSTKDFSYTITGGFMLAGGSAAEIRRALDARALGSSLAFTADYQKVMVDSGEGTLHAFVSSQLTKELCESLARASAKSGGLSQLGAPMTSQTYTPIGVSMIPEQDGFVIEAHLPASLAVMGLTAMVNAKPASYGINPTTGIGIQNSTSPRTGNRSTPTLTNDDLRYRRP